MPRKGGAIWFSLVLLTVVNAGWWLWLQTVPEHTAAWNYAFNAAYGITYFAAAWFAAVAAWRWRASVCPDGIGVLLFAVAHACFGVGLWIWTLMNVTTGAEIPSPSLVDLFFAAASALLIVAPSFLLLHAHRTVRFRHWQSALYVGVPTVLALAVPLGAYTFLLSGANPLISLDQYYVGTGLVSAFTLLICIQRERHEFLRQFLVVTCVGVVAATVANAVYGLRVASDRYWNGDVSDGLFLLAGLLYLLAVAFLPSALSTHPKSEKGGTATRRERVELFIPGVLVVAGFLIAFQGARFVYDNGAAVERHRVQVEIEQAIRRVQSAFSERLAQVYSTVGFVEGSVEVESEEFDVFMRLLGREGDGVVRIALLDRFGAAIRESQPDLVSGAVSAVAGPLLDRVKQEGTIVVSDPIAVSSDELAILILAPVEHSDDYAAAMAVVPLVELFQGAREAVGEQNLDVFAVFSGSYQFDFSGERLSDRSGRVLFGDAPTVESVTPWTVAYPSVTVAMPFALGTSEWTMRSEQTSGVYSTYLLSVGFFFTVLLVTLLTVSVIYLLIGQRTQLRVELERKSHALNQFVSLVAHQLRAPMTQLRWATEHLASHPRLPKDVRELVVQMDFTAEREARLVSDLLNVSRIERGVLKMVPETVGVAALVREVTAPFQARAKELDVTMAADAARDRHHVTVDRQKAVEALRNVLDNALKFSPSGGTVRLFVSEVTDVHVVLAIQDQGPGISREARHRLFDIQLAEDTSASEAGAGPASTGLGLYLTAQFLRAMGGSISFDTGSHGTTFYARLPRAAARRIASARSKR